MLIRFVAFSPGAPAGLVTMGSGTGETWNARDSRTDDRLIKKATLRAFNPVTWPAYADSSLMVEVRRKDGRVEFAQPETEPQEEPKEGHRRRSLGRRKRPSEILRDVGKELPRPSL